MFMRSMRIGRLAGIPIGIQPLWFLILAFITWTLGAVYYPDVAPGIKLAPAYALGLGSALLLFASVILHELGHSVVARRAGVEIEQIDLWLLGGVARMKGYPGSPGDELRFALAGPAVTLVIALGFGAVAATLPDATPEWLRAVVEYQLIVNTAILAFNMLPAFPLDGGRVVRALIWGWRDDLNRATAVAATIGRGFGYGLIGFGILLVLAGAVGGIWIALVGFFVTVAGKAEQGGLRVRSAFSGTEAGRFMTFPAVTIPAEITVDDAVREYFIRYGYTSFPVLEGGRPVGLLDIDHIERIPKGQRAMTTVRDAANTDSELVIDEHQDVAEILQSPSFQEAGRVIVRTDRGGLGILSITDTSRVLRAMDLMDSS